MLKMFLVGLGAGYVVFTENGHGLVKKYMEMSNILANKGLDAVNGMIPKESANDTESLSDDE